MGKKNNEKNNLYDDLFEEASSLFEEEETETDSNSGISLEELRNRARALRKRLLLHQNHADRHNLQKICDEGLKLISKITSGSREKDLFSLEDKLDTIETNLDLCEQEFEKEKARYDIILERIDAYKIPATMLQEFQYKIKEAKIDVYSVQYSPDDLLSEYHRFLDQKEEHKVLQDKLNKQKESLKMEIYKDSYLSYFTQIYNELISRIDRELSAENMISIQKKVYSIISECGELCELTEHIKQLCNEITDPSCLHYYDKDLYSKLNTFEQKRYNLRCADINDYKNEGKDLKSEIESKIRDYYKNPVEIGDQLYNNYSYSEAKKWYEIAAKEGDSYAAFRMYQITHYFSWLEKSASDSYPDALVAMGKYYETNQLPDDALKYYKKAVSKNNNPYALFSLGQFYITYPDRYKDYSFLHSIFKSAEELGFREAVRLILKAADLGYHDAIQLLYDIYFHNTYHKNYNCLLDYIPKNKIMQYLKEDARKGDDRAIRHLSEMNEYEKY